MFIGIVQMLSEVAIICLPFTVVDNWYIYFDLLNSHNWPTLPHSGVGLMTGDLNNHIHFPKLCMQPRPL